MRVLYVVGACLFKNTSANMSHNCYIQGLLENNCDVDIIMSSDSWGQSDSALPHWDKARYFVYKSVSKSDSIRKKFSNAEKTDFVASNGSNDENGCGSADRKVSLKGIVRSSVKKIFYSIFPRDPVYPLEAVWLKKASRFKNEATYDIVISNSSPAASHKLVEILISKGNIKCDRWIQIWEDPWFFDLYGGHSELIKEEEHKLLQCASEVFYVSPLTLQYQKKYYSDCADKMNYIPLPAMKYENEGTVKTSSSVTFGYFGDYYSVTRDLLPFYNAMCESNSCGYIFGDSDLKLNETENLKIGRRVTLEQLSNIQGRTDVLVHLCNLRGGQIPGKIYHYSLTNKPILFILDGTVEEQQEIKRFFEQFNRYFFCSNNKQSIIEAISYIKSIYAGYTAPSVDAFEPVNVVKKLLEHDC